MVQNQAGVPSIMHFVLPESPYDLWIKGELHEAIGIPDDGRTRVEIIGGEIVVSPTPLFDHARIATHITNAFSRFGGPNYPWSVIQGVHFNLPNVADGYIPDLIVMSTAEFDVTPGGSRHLIARQVAMTVEITSRSNAADDRKPGSRRRRPTKWNGYARERVPYYLLVDRDPKAARTTLFTEPDPETGEYQAAAEWPFGETITLPEPFDIKIPTDTWQPWEE